MKPLKTPYIDIEAVDNAVTLWREGGLVGLPTETVYGLAADACNGQAVAKIYAVKSRPRFNPLILHVADATIAQRYVQWNARAERLAAAFWPGALTLVLPRLAGGGVSDLASAGGDTLAVRVPAHPLALRALAAFGGAIAAPSANRSGRISPTTAQHVREELGDAVPLVLDGGACPVGVESTVIDISGEGTRLLRPGIITRAAMDAVLKPIECAVEEAGAQPSSGALKSPGLLASHYAPGLPVRLNATEVTADEALLAFGDAPLVGACCTLNLSPCGDLLEAAANLFAHLRALDAPPARAIAVMPIPTEGVGEAILDRLQRAAAPHE